MDEIELEYKENIIPYSRKKLVNKLKEALNQSRFEHVLRVEQMAIKLAKLNNFDEELASIGGLVHDYAKQRPDEDFIAAIKKYHLSEDLLNYGNAIWHGAVGYLFVKNELKISNIDVLNAVKYHTTGAKYMSTLSKIVYMADYLEMGRDFPGVEEARKITFNNLQDGVSYQTKRTLEYLISDNKLVYPKTIDTYNQWVVNSKIK